MAESAPGSRDAPDEESDQVPESPPLSVPPSEEEEDEEGSQWVVGAACCTIWSGDGLLYPATVRALDTAAGTCLVEFVGYGNKEEVALADLLPPCIPVAGHLGAQWAEEGPYGESRRPRPPPSWELPPGRRRKSSKGKQAPCSPWPPELVPPPWPPAPLCTYQEEEEEEALAAMLMSWYMSGYHTGFYMGLREGRAEAAALLPRRGCRQKKSSLHS
ncbi:survival motor neuron protein 1-like [Struthio camelus]|uniref:survival motor neuron protein 1-like n=1 Tax=Struthio camelus TaxID=8801 RepID=UPI003603B8C8